MDEDDRLGPGPPEASSIPRWRLPLPERYALIVQYGSATPQRIPWSNPKATKDFHLALDEAHAQDDHESTAAVQIVRVGYFTGWVKEVAWPRGATPLQT